MLCKGDELRLSHCSISINTLIKASMYTNSANQQHALWMGDRSARLHNWRVCRLRPCMSYCSKKPQARRIFGTEIQCALSTSFRGLVIVNDATRALLYVHPASGPPPLVRNQRIKMPSTGVGNGIILTTVGLCAQASRISNTLIGFLQ